MKARFLFLFLRGGPLSPARSLEEEEGEGHSIVPRVILALGGRSGSPRGRSVGADSSAQPMDDQTGTIERSVVRGKRRNGIPLQSF